MIGGICAFQKLMFDQEEVKGENPAQIGKEENDHKKVPWKEMQMH